MRVSGIVCLQSDKERDMNLKIDLRETILETPRLYIRPWRFTDLDDFYEYASIDGVGQMAGWKPHESKEESRQILKLFIDEKKTLALELKENGKVIGSLGIEEYNENKFSGDFEQKTGRELGFVLSKSYWGKVLMPEAVQRVISYCFDELSLDFLTVGHFMWNEQSKRVIEKCGFRFYCEDECVTRMGAVENEYSYVLFKK